MSELVVKQFNENGYVYLPGFLDLESCDKLTQTLKDLVVSGQTHKDDQSPLSEAVYASEVLDSLLEQLLPHFEQASGKKLYPTYSYARLYKKGDSLKPHTDRPSCEISATLTMGFDNKPWAIFVAEEAKEEDQINKTGEKITLTSGNDIYLNKISKIDMQVGDAVLYHGMQNVHWRETFEGEWQAQVFLHYVDANGPNADWLFDKKEKLTHHKTKEQTEPDWVYWTFEDGFSLDSCNKLIESYETQLQTEKAAIADSKIDLNVRDVNKIQLPSHRGIGATLAGMALVANKQAWKFDVEAPNQTEYLKYDVDGHYVSHIDTSMRPSEFDRTRKLTILAFLNDDFEGGRFYIQIGDKKDYPPQKAGTVLIFPSFFLHGVEPVIKGTRRSVVTWLVGPWFK